MQIPNIPEERPQRVEGWRWPNINPTLGRRLVFAVSSPTRQHLESYLVIVPLYKNKQQ